MLHASAVGARFFLWQGEAMYMGDSVPSAFHRHYALQIGIGLDGPIRVRTNRQEDFLRTPAFLVPPNVPHQVDASGVNSVLIWSEFATHIVLPELKMDGVTMISDGSMRSPLSQLGDLNIEAAECSQARLVFDHLLSQVATRPEYDSRVTRAAELLRAVTVDDASRILAKTAAQVHLSQSRLRHIFKQDTGISLQRFLLWQRLMRAVTRVGEGISLTEAAHTAGFADSAHLARFFRASFGVRASEIFKDSHSVQVIPCASS